MLASKIKVTARWLIRADMPAVLKIEQASFEEPWSGEDFLRVLRQRSVIGMVAEIDGDKVVGYMLYELFRDKFHLLNFAVAPDYRLRRIGAQMMAKLTTKLGARKRRRITIDLRESNLPAQKFFRRMGFLATRVARDYFEDTGEDAYVMEYRIAGEPETVAELGEPAIFDELGGEG